MDAYDRFSEWIEKNGGQMRGCQVSPCPKDPNMGLGLFAPEKGIKPADEHEEVVMVIPLSLTWTPAVVMNDPHLGERFQKLLQERRIDERMLLMLYLVIERARGRESFWEPYISVLPSSVGTTIFYSEDELEELKGTPVYAATKAKLKALRKVFDGRFGPIVEELLSEVQLSKAINYEDFLWAHSVFWSRALNIPVPRPLFDSQKAQTSTKTFAEEQDKPSHPPPRAPSLASDMHPAQHGSETVSALHPEERTADDEENDGSPVFVEGLVPGIDFANHEPWPRIRWEVEGDPAPASGVPDSVCLITGPGMEYSPNSEICITYGSKGNEELLFLYGFVLEDNPAEFIMMHFPQSDLYEDPHCEEKSQLLQCQELELRWLLPETLLKPHLAKPWSNPREEGGGDQGAPSTGSKVGPHGLAAEEKHSPDSQGAAHGLPGMEEPVSGFGSAASGRETSDSCTAPSAGGDGTHEVTVFPEDCLAALRVLAMGEEEMEKVIALLYERRDPGSEEPPSEKSVRLAVWEVCSNTGALNLIVHLLEARRREMEEATGTEESDQVLLLRDRMARARLAGGSPRSGESADGSLRDNDLGLLSSNHRASLVYRLGQKRLTREFLDRAKEELARLTHSRPLKSLTH